MAKFSDTQLIQIITNLLGRKLLTNEHLACILGFPKRQITSTKQIILRIKKMGVHWKYIAIFLCFSKGTGKFPVISRRLFSAIKQEEELDIQLYSLNLKNGEIVQLWRKKIDDQTEKQEEKAS